MPTGLLLFAQGAYADESGFQGLSGGKLLETTFGLLLVLGLIFILARVLQRMQASVGGGNKLLGVVSSLNLGTRERILLLRAADKYILVAATPHSMSALHVFDELPEPAIEQATVETGFSSLMQSLKGGGQQQ